MDALVSYLFDKGYAVAAIGWALCAYQTYHLERARAYRERLVKEQHLLDQEEQARITEAFGQLAQTLIRIQGTLERIVDRLPMGGRLR